ncbi:MULTISPECIES: hypothetical protein [Marinobacter]|jgi:DNA-directed RNA polymerase subunit RPC12/RpoP|uniref:hypothetical protein n=1 Tax=Marinobacter TaxID=2742 RepID=UPI00077395DF|nr:MULTISPECIES: hypothetical protein [Marinobacter]PSF14832.1 hypothetical protein C7H10_03255 [Marinobacter shengliensis]
MDTWIIFTGIGVAVLFAIYHSGARSEKILNYQWIAQFKDEESNDVIVRIFSSKEMYEGSRDLKKRDFREVLDYFNSADDIVRDYVFSEREQTFFSHPAISKPIAPLSFNPVHGTLPPKAVINWLDLMAWLAGQELMAVRYYGQDVGLSTEHKQKLMIDCPSCGGKMNVLAGKTMQTTCPHCGSKFKVTA